MFLGKRYFGPLLPCSVPKCKKLKVFGDGHHRIYMDSLHAQLRKRNELYCGANVATEPAKYPNQAAVQMIQMAKYPNQIKLKVNSSVSFWVVPVHPLWINQWWCSATILHLIGLNNKKTKIFEAFQLHLRKMVQSPINYSVHVVVSGPRHPCTTC